MSSQTVLFQSCRIRASRHAVRRARHSHPNHSIAVLLEWGGNFCSMICHNFPSSAIWWVVTGFSDTPKWKFPKIGVPTNHPKWNHHFSIETHGFGDPPFSETPKLTHCKSPGKSEPSPASENWTQFRPKPSRNLWARLKSFKTIICIDDIIFLKHSNKLEVLQRTERWDVSQNLCTL